MIYANSANDFIRSIIWMISHLAGSNKKLNSVSRSLQAFLTYAGSVQVGAQSGIQECKHQFAWDRWNCPQSTLQLSTHNGHRSGKKGFFVFSKSNKQWLLSLWNHQNYTHVDSHKYDTTCAKHSHHKRLQDGTELHVTHSLHGTVVIYARVTHGVTMHVN